jgi:predicted O-methyltransferase YrrM
MNVKKKLNFLKNIVDNHRITNIMEIGFNAGHSAETFLSSNKNINLTSFDIGEKDYLKQ